jgi:hypothetical protein
MCCYVRKITPSKNTTININKRYATIVRGKIIYVGNSIKGHIGITMGSNKMNLAK